MASSSLQLPYLTVVGAIAIATVFFFVVARPMFDEINTTKDQLAQEQATLAERTAFLQSLDRRLQDLQANQVHVDRLAVILPAQERVEDELRILHQRATTSGLIIDAITNVSDSARTQLLAQKARGENVDVADSVVPVAFTVNVHGAYQSFRAFLTALENSPRLTDVRDIRVSEGGDGVDQISGHMTIQFYTIDN